MMDNGQLCKKPEYLCFLFCVCSIAGWCLEVCFRSIVRRQLDIPGFLTGPYCPIYGFCVLLIVFFCKSSDNYLAFIKILLLTSTVELAVSWFFERVFGQLLWDYSGLPLCIGNRVCLLYSLAWGTLGLWMLREIEPKLENFFSKYARFACNMALFIGGIIMLDAIFTVIISLS